jgi:hypothetical protein
VRCLGTERGEGHLFFFCSGTAASERETSDVREMSAAAAVGGGVRASGRGTQFTCFTGTKVQVLTLKALLGAGERLLLTYIPDILLLG